MNVFARSYYWTRRVEGVSVFDIDGDQVRATPGLWRNDRYEVESDSIVEQ